MGLLYRRLEWLGAISCACWFRQIKLFTEFKSPPMHFLSIARLLFAFSCFGFVTGTVNAQIRIGDFVYPLWTEDNSGLLDPMQSVIRDRNEFTRIWSKMYANSKQDGRHELPTVDFSKEVVIVASGGWRSTGTGGYSMKVDSIQQYGNALDIVFAKYYPGKNCVATFSSSAPAIMLKIDIPTYPIQLHEKSYVVDCEIQSPEKIMLPTAFAAPFRELNSIE